MNLTLQCKVKFYPFSETNFGVLKKISKCNYSLYMENSWLFEKNPVHVNSVLEIRICRDMWENIATVAKVRGVSYSWVVRYALFRLIRRKNPLRFIGQVGNPQKIIFYWGKIRSIRSLNNKAWKRRVNSSLKHRHRLCLYGEDELYIRLTAVSLECSMTHLVRLALEMYLPRLLSLVGRSAGLWKSMMSQVFFYWLGIKVNAGVEFHASSAMEKQWSFERYMKFEYY